MTLRTEYALTRGKALIVHRRFPYALRVICGPLFDRTVTSLGGRRMCSRCARYPS